MYNRMKLPYFGLNVRLLLKDLFRIRIRIQSRIRIRIRIQIRIQNVYFGSGSDPNPAKSFGSFRIRIRNTGLVKQSLWYYYKCFGAGSGPAWIRIDFGHKDPQKF